MVERFICADCNNSFSVIDQALAERSLVALTRVANTSKDAFKAVLGALVTQYDEAGDIYVEMQVRNEFAPVALTQFHLRSSGQGTIVAQTSEDLALFVAFVDRLIATNDLRSLHTFIGIPGGTCTSGVIVMKREDEGYVRLPSQQDAKWFYQTLESNWASLRDQVQKQTFVPSPQPKKEVAVHFSYAPNQVYRAIAKTTFNTLASKIGSRILESTFDPIRRYILGELKLPSVENTDEIAIDSRFVQQISPEQKELDFADEHSVVFAYDEPRLIAFVTLYGDHLFLVKFPDIEALPLDQLSGHSFSHNRSGNSSMDFNVIAARLLEKHLERFGMDPSFAAQMAALLRENPGQ